MRAAVKSLFIIWATVTAASLCGLIYILPGYSVDSAFSQALRTHPSPEGAFWFHWCLTFFLVGACVTVVLYRTYRKQYGRLWKSN